MRLETNVLLSSVTAAGNGAWVNVGGGGAEVFGVEFAGAPGGDTVELYGKVSSQVATPTAADQGSLLGLRKNDNTYATSATASGIFEVIGGFAIGWVRAKKAGTAQAVTVRVSGRKTD